jgi:hypothetical protein
MVAAIQSANSSNAAEAMTVYPIRFSVNRAREVLQALKQNQSLPVPANGWDGFEYIQLAGILLYAALEQGPQSIDREGLAERVKAIGASEDVRMTDLHDGIEFVADLTALLVSGDYQLPPTMHVAVFRDAEGQQRAEVLGAD